jgi:hypothetical protein
MPEDKKPSKPRARKPAPGSSAARRAAAPKAPESEYLRDREADIDAEDDFEEASSGPVAVGGSSGLGARLASMGEEEENDAYAASSSFDDQLFNLPPVEAPTPVPVTTDGPTVVDHPRQEMIAGALALLLAASTFLPWYKAGTATLSGWAGGRFGPIVTFLALGAVAIVGLRKLGKAVSFPLDHALILEGIGWVCTLGILASNLMPPKLGYAATSRNSMLFVSLLLAVGLALFAGRISSGAPFVMRPGWFGSVAGKLGAAILIIALGAGAAVGFVVNKDPSVTTPTANPSNAPKPVAGLPPCIKQYKFPIPQGVKAINGYPNIGGQCIAFLSTKLSMLTVYSRYQSALKSSSWKFTKGPVAKGQTFRSLTLTKPRCGLVTIAASKGKVVQFYVNLRECTPPSPGRN